MLNKLPEIMLGAYLLTASPAPAQTILLYNGDYSSLSRQGGELRPLAQALRKAGYEPREFAHFFPWEAERSVRHHADYFCGLNSLGKLPKPVVLVGHAEGARSVDILVSEFETCGIHVALALKVGAGKTLTPADALRVMEAIKSEESR